MANAAVVTQPGRSILWNRMRGSGTEPLNIGWGTSATTASAASDVNLFAPATETRVAGTSTLTNSTGTVLADTYQVTGTLTCLVGGKTITEAGLFDTTTLSGTATTSTSITASGQLSVTLGATIGPTSLNFYAQIANEVLLVTGGQNTAVLTFSRAQLGTSAGASYAIGTPFTVGGDGGAHVANASIGGQTATVNAAAGGNMFAHADFGGIALNVNDSILFTWKDTLT